MEQARIACTLRPMGLMSGNVYLTVGQLAKSLLIEEHPIAEKDIRQENGHWIYEGDVAQMEGIGRFVIGLAADIRIKESTELETYVASYVKSIWKTISI